MKQQRNIFKLLGLALLLLALPLTAAVRINEVLFAPSSGGQDAEFIELYNTGPGDVDLQGWKLKHGEDELYGFPDELILAAGEYLVIYMGSPIAPPSNSISLDYDAEQLDDYGAHLLLEDAAEAPHDYVAYGNVVSTPPAPLVFTAPISLASPWQTGDSVAYLEQDGSSNDDYRQWINRRGSNITPGGANTRQPEPILSYGTVTEPASFPAVNSCEEIEIPLEISYSNETPLRDVTVEFTVPDGAFYVFASDGGVFANATRTISWSLGTLTGNHNLFVRLKASCEAAVGATPPMSVSMDYRRYLNQASPHTANASNTISSIELHAAELELDILHYTSNEPAIVVKPGQVVEFKVIVKNSGTGALLNSSSLLELLASPASLSLLAFRQDGPTGTPIENLSSNISTGTFTGNIGTLAAGASKTFYLKLLTIGCPTDYACIKATVNWGCAEEAPGTQSCSKEVSNAGNVYCPPELRFITPSGEPAVYSGCHDVKRQVLISNPNSIAMQPQGLELQLPEGYYWISSSIGNTAAGDYDQANGTVSFSAAELSDADGEIKGNGETTIDLVMRPGCTAVSDRSLSAVFNYGIDCPMRSFEDELVEQSSQIKLLQPSLSVAVQNPDNPLLTTVEAERGQLVTFHVVVSNNGMGDLDSDGKPLGEEGGWLELDKIGSGLLLDSVTDITGGAAAPITPGTSSANNPRWATGAIDAGGKRTYEVKFRVIDCTDVSYDIGTYWTCWGVHKDDYCRQDGESKGSVNIILRNPLLSLEVDPFTISYCDGVTVSIPVSNADGPGIGSARNVSINMFGMNLADYDIIDDENSDFAVEIDGNIAIFNLVKGIDSDADGTMDDMAKNSATDLIFTVKLKDGRCAAATRGELIFQPYYEDSCGIPFTAGTMLGSFTRSSPPEATLTKTGPVSAQVGNKNLTWTITLSYSGTPNEDFSYTLLDNYPNTAQSDFAAFSIVSVSDSGGPLTKDTDYTDDGSTISRTVETTFDAEGNYSETYTIVFDAPDTPCAGGHHYINNASVNILTPAEPTDCNGCPMWMARTARAAIAIYNADEPEIDGHTRRVTYENINVHGLDNGAYQTAGESCSKIIFDHLVRFTGAAPANWEIDVDAGPDEDLRSLRFQDTLDNLMRAPGDGKNNLAVEIYYFSSSWPPGSPSGIDYGPGGIDLVSWDDITYVSPGQSSNGSLQIDLKGLDALSSAGPKVPSDGGILWIRYTLESQRATAGAYDDFARISVPNIGGDLCGLGPETHYYQFVPVRVVDPEARVAVSNVSSPDPRHIDRCETATYRFSLSSHENRPFDHYDVRLVADLQGNYRYAANSTVFGDGLRDEGGQPLTAFEPQEDGTQLIWNLGDLRGLHSGSDHYIEIEVEKDCDQSSTQVLATVYNNVMCNQVADTNGPGAASEQDSAVAALSSFSHDDSDSYEPHLYTGRLETRFASSKVYYNDGYPSALIHVVNSGNGALYNVRVPVELGSVINGTASLTFVEATVTAVSGQASVTVGTLLTPVLLGTEYAHGYREASFAIDSMAASTVVTIELRLRMVLCQDLSLRIAGAHWGCPPGLAGSCLDNLDAPELNDTMNILSGDARALIVEHGVRPSVIDMCGSTTRISIEAVNAGGVDVYEPTIRERLPEGMVIVPDSVKYSVNGNPLQDFPAASGAGLRYSSLTTTSTPGVGDYQTLLWVFTDPNLDGDEADSLLSTAAYDDPYPDDTYFNRHKVLKPGTRIRIEFDVELSGCDNALAYKKSSRRAEAALLFDLPCHHDNRIYPDGTPAGGSGRRTPLDDNTRENSFLDPGVAQVVIDMAGKNMTQDGEAAFSQVNGDKDDLINWYIGLNSIGIGAVPNPQLEIFIPSVLNVDFATAPPEISSPANLTFTNDNPTGVPQLNPAGTWYTFTFDNSDAAMIAAGREHYFAATDQISIVVPSSIAQCSSEKPLVEAIIRWGCCFETPGLESAHSFDHASTAVKTRPESPSVKVSEGDGALVPVFDSCLGAYTITLTSPSLNNELYLHEIDVSLEMPDGWTYAPLDGDSSDFFYESVGARPADARLSAAEEEPTIVGKTLRWTSVTRGGNIPDAKAKLFPQEVLKIVVYLRADGSGVNCDLNGKTNPAVPSFVQTINFGNYQDSCGDPLDSPKAATVAIVPEHPNLSISLTPSTRFINDSSTEVEWLLRIQNIGDKDADNVALEVDFGSGYSTIALKNKSPSTLPPPTNITNNTGSWDMGVIGTIPQTHIFLWTFTATIDTANRGPLQAKATVNGYCLERDGSTGCTYSFAETEEFISGATINKVIDGTRLAAPAVSTDPGPNSAVAKAAEVSLGSIVRYLITVNVYEGGANDVIIRDVLPAGLQFLEAYLVDHNGAWVADLVSTVIDGNTRVFSHEHNPALAAITGGRLGNNALFLEIWAQVLNQAANEDGTELENTAQLTIKRGNQTFDHNSSGLGLFESNTLTVLEPHIKDDEHLTKTADPASLPADHSGQALDIEDKPAGDNPIKYVFTARNSGSSPAYEVEFTDNFPWQLANPASLASPYALLVEIVPDGGGAARTLTASTDYSSSWTAGIKPNPATFKVNLLNTAAAALGVDETLRITYHGQVAHFAPGTYVDNLAAITAYSSLPGSGASFTTAKSTSLAESGDERVNYADGYHDLTDRRTYHKFTTDLIASGKIMAEITPHSDGTPPELRDDGTTRATIGEKVEYHIRLSLPKTISLEDLAFDCDLPSELIVNYALWEVVPKDADFADPINGGTLLSYSTLEGYVRGRAGNGANDFPLLLENNTGQDQELLIKIILAVSEYNNFGAPGGAPVLKGDSCALPASFTWDSEQYSDSVDPIPELTIVEPLLSTLAKTRSKHLQADNATAATSPGTASYNNYYAIGPDNANGATTPVENVHQVRPTDIIEYTVSFKNEGDAAAWDVELLDLIPVGMTLRAGSATVSATPADTVITISEPTLPGTPYFTINRVLPEHEVTVTYRCDVDSNVAAGRYLQNQVDLQEYRSLPKTGVAYPNGARTATSGNPDAYVALGPEFASLGTEYPTTSKTVAAEMTLPATDGTVQATIGELMTYTITVDIPDTTVLYELEFLDKVPDGLKVVSASYSYLGGAAVDLDLGGLSITGVTSISSGVDPLGDFAGVSGVQDELVITIRGWVKQKFQSATGAIDNGPFGVGAANGIIDAGDIIQNNASISWNQIKGQVTANSQDAEPLPIEFVIVEPKLVNLTKTKASHTPAAFLGQGDGYRNYNSVGPNPNNSGAVNDVDQVQPGHIVKYTVTVTNTGNAIAYDVAFMDTIPIGMSYVAGSATVSAGPLATNTGFSWPPSVGLRQSLTFTLSQLEPGNTATVEYQLQVDVPVAAGRYLLNVVELANYASLPRGSVQYPDEVRRVHPRINLGDPPPDEPTYEELDPVWTDVGTLFPTATKTVESEISLPSGKLDDGTARGTIGEVMTYEILLDLPDNTILYDLLVEDIIPANLTVQAQDLANDDISYADINSNGTVTRYPLDGNELSVDGNNIVRFYLESDVRAANGVTNEIRLLLAVTVDDVAANVAGTSFANSVTSSWNQIDEDPGIAADRSTLNIFTTPDNGTVDFTIIEPLLASNALTKTRTGHFNEDGSVADVIGSTFYRNYNAVGPVTHTAKQDPVPSVYQVRPTEIVEYTLTFKNTGNARAYDIVLTDLVPDGLRLLSAVPHVPSISADDTVGIAFLDPPTQTLAGDPVTMKVNWLDADDTATLVFRMQIVPGVAAGAYLQNQVSIEDYGSTPDATALFPELERDIASDKPTSYGKPHPKFEKIGIVYPIIGTKTVESEFTPPLGQFSDGSVRGTIGEVMTYEVLIDVPDGTVLFDLLLEDLIPANLTVQDKNLVPEDITYAVINNNGSTDTYTLDDPQLTLVDNRIRLYLPTDVRAEDGVENEIRLVMAVTVDNVAANVAGTVFGNAVTTSWSQRNDSPGDPENRQWLNTFTTPEAPGTVDFTIVEPLLAVDSLNKARSGHFKADGSEATSPGTATYTNYYAAGPDSNAPKQDIVPNVYQVRPTEIVEYTLTFKNTGNARAYDIVLRDEVPSGFTLLTAAPHAPAIAAATTSDIAFLNAPSQLTTGDPVGMKINWLDADDTASITFRMRIEPGIAAGAYLQNQASIVDYGSSPDDTAVFPDLERDTDSTDVAYAKPYSKFEKLGSEYPVTSKTVQTELTAPSGKLKDGSSCATIGELITYEIRLDIKDDLSMFDSGFSDLLPDGLEVVKAVYSIKGGPEVHLSVESQGDGRTLVTDTATPLADLTAQNGLDDEVIFTITATVKQKFVSGLGATDQGSVGIVDNGDVFANNAAFTWNQLDNQDTLNTQNAEPAPITLSILEPKLDDTFIKVITRVLDTDGSTEVTTARGHTGVISAGVVTAAVDGKTSYFRYPAGGGNPTLVEDVQVVLPDDYVEYRIEVKNTGTTTAFDLVISDILPPPAALTYVSGTGDFTVGTSPYTSGSADSILTVSNTVESVAGVDHSKLAFQIDMLAADDTAVITYRAQVAKQLGAGYYIGMNVANLEDYSSLPDGLFTVDVGNLAAGEAVSSTDGERNASSDPAYDKQGPRGDDIGVQYPEFATKIYRRYDVHGNLTDTELTATTNVRIGDILIHELIATLPRYTTLFDGGAAGSKAMAYRYRLNRGYHLIPGTEEFDTGDIDLSTLHHADSPTDPHYVSGNYQYPSWHFNDVVNSSSDSQTAILRFQTEIRTKEHTGADYFTDQSASVSSANRYYLYWNTIDAAEKATLSSSTALNTGDHPFLQRDNVNTVVVQPNLQLFKTSSPDPDSTIGVTGGVGDTVIYTLTLRNWNNAGAADYRGRGIAYDIELTDLLPKDLAPVPPAEPLLTAAVHSVNSGSGDIAAALRALVLDSDYTYSYAFDSVTKQGRITFKTIRDEANIDYDARVEANQALVITYEVLVNPAIGAQGSGAGQRVNLAEIEKYQSLPAGTNDDSRKEYGPEGPRRVTLLTEVPSIVKASANADGSVLPGEVIEYTLTAPSELIRANLYEVEIRDELPDGLSFGADGTVSGVGLEPTDILALDVGDGAGFVNGNEIEVTGIKGDASISITGRVLSILIDQIEPEGSADQVTVTVRAMVKAQFDNGLPLNRLHEFRNLATLFWYDADDTYTLRARHASMSNAISHYFDARGILFEPSHTGTAQPATIRTYRHWLRNFEENDLTVPIEFSAIQPDWVWQLFIGDGEGNMVSGPFESGYAVPVAANDATEVIMRVFVPADITTMITDVLTITATGAEDNVITVTDVTVVQVERVAVFKEISTTGDYKTRMEVQPQQNNNVNQRIRFINNGPEAVKNVYIYDFIPEHTSYVANSAINDAEFNLEYSKDGGVNWIAGEPAEEGEAVSNGLVPKVTNLRWLYNGGGTLIPGVEKVITFQLRIK